MTGAATYTLYALLIMGDGQETERRPVSYGRTLEQCMTLLGTRQPSAAVVDLGWGPEAVETVFGCEQETPFVDRESATDIRGMFEAASREDWQ